MSRGETNTVNVGSPASWRAWVGVWVVAVFLGLGGCVSKPVVRGDVGAFAREPAPWVVGADYRIGTPDRVAVMCERLPELGVPDAAVSADGTIEVPLLGAVVVSGLTADEASDLLSRRAEVLLPGAAVELTVTRHASRHVYVFGAMTRTGPVAWRPGLRLMDVLNEAPPTPEAATDRVDVIRPAEDPSLVRRLTVDAARWLAEGDATANVVLRPGDVVHMPRRDGVALAWSPLVPLPVANTEQTSGDVDEVVSAEAESVELEDVDAQAEARDADEVARGREQAVQVAAIDAGGADIEQSDTDAATETAEPDSTALVSRDDAGSPWLSVGPTVVWENVPVSASAAEVYVPGETVGIAGSHSPTAAGRGYFGLASGGEASSSVGRDADASRSDGGVVFWD